MNFKPMSTFSGKQEEELLKKSGPIWLRAVAALVLVGSPSTLYYFYHQKRVSTLDGFARCITAKNAKMYGLYWCPHCQDQKEMFGHAFQFVNYVECGIKGGRAETEECKQAGVKNFPTWQFSDGSRLEGAQPLAVLSQKNGCSLP
jgi:hypothetical protein